MERPGDAASQHSAPSDQAWLGEYLARTTEYWQRTARGTSVLAAKFGDRSLKENDWTIDTVTADVIEAWEELTPLLGEGLELWLEAVQRGLRADASMGDDPTAADGLREERGTDIPDVTLLTARAGEYLAVWEAAAARLVNAEYHSEDLIDDWFTCWGKWVRDSTALATIGWKAWVAEGASARRQDGAADA